MADGKNICELRGENKSPNQIRDYKNTYIASDDMENGIFYTIPLWLFGLYYIFITGITIVELD